MDNNSNNRNRNTQNTRNRTDSESTGTTRKVVRKVENTRFYERENPEANMRRRGRTSLDFEEEKNRRDMRSYSTGANTRQTEQHRKVDQDGVPEFRGFRRSAQSEQRRSGNDLYEADNYATEQTRYSKTVSQKSTQSIRETRRRKSETYKSEDSVRSARREEYSENDSAVYREKINREKAKREKVSLKPKSEDKPRLYSDESEKDSSRDSLPDDEVNKKRKTAAERIAEKKRKKEIIARSNERGYKRQVLSRKRQKKLRTGQLFRVLIFVLIVVVVLVIILAKGNYEDPYGTSHITTGTISFSTDAKASFVREEAVFSAPASGILVAAVNEGEKVAAGTTIAYVTTSEHTEHLAELEDIESKILTVKNSGSSSMEILSADCLIIDQELEKLAAELAVIQGTGNFSKYSNIKSEIDMLFAERNSIVSDSQGGNSYLEYLESERQSLLDKIDNDTHEIIVDVSGVVSFNVDGNETAFTSYAQSLSVDGTAGITVSTPKNTSSEYSNFLNTNVGSGTAVAKVVTANEYYIAATVSGGLSVKTGDTVSVKSKDRSYSSDAEVISVAYSAGETLVICKTSNSLVSSLGARSIEADLITGNYEGMKVPLSCLTEFDEAGTTARITLLNSNIVEYVYVDVLAKDDEYAIISNKSSFADAEITQADGSEVSEESSVTVKVNDIYILNPSYVSEGEVMK